MECDKSELKKSDLILNILNRSGLKYKLVEHKQDKKLEFVIYKKNDKAIYHFSNTSENANKLNRVYIQLSEDDKFDSNFNEVMLSAIYDMICETKQFYIMRYENNSRNLVFNIPSFNSMAELQIKLNLMG